jgi:hypothetical protein
MGFGMNVTWEGHQEIGKGTAFDAIDEGLFGHLYEAFPSFDRPGIFPA